MAALTPHRGPGRGESAAREPPSAPATTRPTRCRQPGSLPAWLPRPECGTRLRRRRRQACPGRARGAITRPLRRRPRTAQAQPQGTGTRRAGPAAGTRAASPGGWGAACGVARPTPSPPPGSRRAARGPPSRTFPFSSVRHLAAERVAGETRRPGAGRARSPGGWRPGRGTRAARAFPGDPAADLPPFPAWAGPSRGGGLV